MTAPRGTIIWARTSIILVSLNLLNSGTWSRNKVVNQEASRHDNTTDKAITANIGQRSHELPTRNQDRHKAKAKAPK